MRNKILIADSNEINIEILSELFSEDYEVLESTSGSETAEILFKERDNLCGALIDAGLTERSGIEIIEEASANDWFAMIPTMILSDDSSLKVEKASYKAGAIDFSRKPFDSSMIKKKMFKYIELFGLKEEVETLRKERESAKAKEPPKPTVEETPKPAVANAQKPMAEKISMEPISFGTSPDEDEFREYYKNMIEMIGTLVEFRNPENRDHIRRMKGLSLIMAETMAQMYPETALDRKKITDIVLACCIHDIGKVAIPDTVMLKPGRLTDDEYEYMKSHTLRGLEILDHVSKIWDDDFDSVARQAIRSHHEKYDGGGYPDGLKGDDIPIAAQIISLVDAYDAMVNDRVYKKAYPKDVAFNKIMSGDCGIFPPKLLECFKACREKLEAWEEGELKLEF